MNCGTCKLWNLAGTMGQQGFGQCLGRTNEVHRASITTSAQNECRIGKWVKADPKTVKAREAAGGALL